MSRIWDALRKAEQGRQKPARGAPTVLPNRVQLTPKQRRAIDALLSASSLDEVVRACGVQESTLPRWMAQPSFVAAYYAAESEQLRDSLHRLRASTGDAVEVLRKALRAGDAAVRIRAAAAIPRAATLADPDRAGTLRDREGAGVADSAAPGVAHKNSS